MMLRRLLSAFGIYCCSTGLWLISAARRTKAIRRDLQKRSIAHLNRSQCVWANCSIEKAKVAAKRRLLLSCLFIWGGRVRHWTHNIGWKREKKNKTETEWDRGLLLSPCEGCKFETDALRDLHAIISKRKQQQKYRKHVRPLPSHCGCPEKGPIGKFHAIDSVAAHFHLYSAAGNGSVCDARIGEIADAFGVKWSSTIGNCGHLIVHIVACRAQKSEEIIFFDFGARVPLYDLIQCEIYCDEPFKQPIHGRQPTFNSSFSNISWSGRPLSAIFQWSNHASICWLVLMVSHGVLQVPAPSTHSQNTNERQKKSIFFISLPTTNENYSEFRRLFFRASTGRTEPGIVRRRKQVKIYKFFVYLRGA